ncbi:acyl carrier protein [Actinokineospora guangxiensis]|uniref:Acyl carrier protein n=1 Tax=Actinokineospora guangxiensis TaxID=1490288 RepID=A0ABW0EGP0_9PSEU
MSDGTDTIDGTATIDSTVTAPIREFITGRFPQLELADDEDIFAMGFVNSLFAMELVMFIEKTFAITVTNEDLQLDNFRTIKAMAALVDGSRAMAGQR